MLSSVIALTALHAASASDQRVLQYTPDGHDIVCVNGKNKYTRALYGGYTDFRIETSDRPIFGIFRNKSHRNVRFHLGYDGNTIRLDSAARCEARYNSGKRTYIINDSSWGKGTITLTVLAMPDREGGIWKFAMTGFQKPVTVKTVIGDIRHPQFKRWGDMGADPADSFDPADNDSSAQSTTSTTNNGTSYIYAECTGDNSYILTELPTKEGKVLFGKALDHHKWLENNIVFETPDPYINTLGGALTSAADGAWDGEVWLHGAIVWRMWLNGWRAGYLGDVLGMPERSRSHFSAYAASQVKDVEPVIPHPSQCPENGLARAAKTWGTQMYSNGYISRNPNRNDVMHHYDMNLNYIDELLWHFQYDADTTYMRSMWDTLTSHLKWEKRNFDPDDDGLYDAYCCIWASDALFYNSGAVTHSTAYNYRAFRMAAQIARILGEDPSYYDKEATKTLSAMNERLWLPERGHWIEYEDFMGNKRKHTHAALWSIYTPIDCDAATPMQAFQATQYVDSCIPHIPVKWTNAPHGTDLYTISTTDWHPYDWSINNVAADEVMHMALAYFQAGRNNEGFNLVKANIMDQAYLGNSPGNFGQISYYDKARGELYRDFSDNAGISSRTFLQGLFGIVPNALDGKCYIRPGFPDEWEHASVSTPYLSYSFKREGNREIYEIEQNFSRPLEIVLRRNNGDGSYAETVGTNRKKQKIVIMRPEKKEAPKALVTAPTVDGTKWGNNFDNVKSSALETVDMARHFNSNVSDIFKNFYLSPRSPYTTLQMPVHGVGEWCHPETMHDIDDRGMRMTIRNGKFRASISDGIEFLSPATGRNIAYTSLWDNYPDSVTIELNGKATHAYLMMAGSTNHMQSRIDNGVITVRYTDGSSEVLPLHNPHNWCPIEQDYYEDGLAFTAASPRPYRVDFANGKVSRELMGMGKHYGNPKSESGAGSHDDRTFEKGAGIILDMPLDYTKELESLTVTTLSNDVVIGLMGVTLQR